MSPFALKEARNDRSLIEDIRENFRQHLLTALSEARASSVGMEPRVRDALMDDLSQQFHPDANASDLFADAFKDAITLADDEIDCRSPRQAAE